MRALRLITLAWKFRSFQLQLRSSRLLFLTLMVSPGARRLSPEVHGGRPDSSLVQDVAEALYGINQQLERMSTMPDSLRDPQTDDLALQSVLARAGADPDASVMQRATTARSKVLEELDELIDRSTHMLHIRSPPSPGARRHSPPRQWQRPYPRHDALPSQPTPR